MLLEEYLGKDPSLFKEYIDILFQSSDEQQHLKEHVQNAYLEVVGIKLPKCKVQYVYDLKLSSVWPSRRVDVIEYESLKPHSEEELLEIYHKGEQLKADGKIVDLDAVSYQKETRISFNYNSITMMGILDSKESYIKKNFIFTLFHEFSHQYFSQKELANLYGSSPWVEETICDFIADEFLERYNCSEICSYKLIKCDELQEEYLLKAKEALFRLDYFSLQGYAQEYSEKLSKLFAFPFLTFFGPEYCYSLPEYLQHEFRHGEKMDKLTELLGYSKTERNLAKTMQLLERCSNVKEIYQQLG